MKLNRDSLFFTVIFIVGLIVLILSIYDIIFDKGLMIAVIVAYAILLALTIFLIVQKLRKLNFPAPQAGKNVEVSVSFVLK